MRKLVIAGLIGSVALWLYRSEQARDRVLQQFTAAPTPVRGGAAFLASATTRGVRRVADVIEAASLSHPLKDRATHVTSALRSAADTAGSRVGLTHDQMSSDHALGGIVENPEPDDLLAEEDAQARAAMDALREKQSGA